MQLQVVGPPHFIHAVFDERQSIFSNLEIRPYRSLTSPLLRKLSVALTEADGEIRSTREHRGGGQGRERGSVRFRLRNA
jgi:hypothetical protein